MLRVAVLVLFCIVAYLPSLEVPFVFDDLPNIALNTRVQPESWSDLPMALDARGDKDRPVAMLSFALNYLQGRLDPTPYHATNIVIHVTAAVLLFALLHALVDAPRSPASLRESRTSFAFAGALIWAVHPVNTQAVTYIVQRMASLAAAFYLLALVLFVLWRLGRLRAVYAIPGVVVSGLLAFGSKEHAATLPAALLLLDIVFFTGIRRYHFYAAAAIGGMVAVLGAVYASRGLEYLATTAPRRDFSGWERLLTEGRVIWHYLSLLVWPDAGRLQLDYDFAVSRSLLSPPTTLLAWGGIAALAVVAVRYMRRWPWPAFGWLFFLLALSIESTVLPLELVFEHRLYLPATLLLAGVLAPLFAMVRSARLTTAAGLTTVAIAGLLSWQTIVRNEQWSDPEHFWHLDRQRGASVDRASLNAAVDLLRLGHPERALRSLQGIDSPASPATRSKIHEVRGEAELLRGNHERALEHFRAVLELRPRWERPAYYAGETLLAMRRIDLARTMLAQMNQYDPGSVYTITLAASIDREEGRFDAAEKRLRSYLDADARRRMADRALVRMHLANAYRAMNRPRDAIEQYREVVRYSPNNWTAWSAMYWMLVANGDDENAERIADYLHHKGVDPAAWRPRDDAVIPGRSGTSPGPNGPVRNSGFTLVEMVVAIVVLAAASAGVLLIFAEATARSADPQIRVQARAVAEAYMDEIVLQAFSDPDQSETGNAEAGEGRGSYDDVWDYRAIGTEAPTDQFGNPIAALSDYSVTVQVGGSPGGGRADITVTATHSSGRVAYDLYGERSQY